MRHNLTAPWTCFAMELETTWAGLRAAVVAAETRAAAAAGAGAAPGVDDVPEACPLFAAAAGNPDSVLNTARYMFFDTRCGVLASVGGASGDRVALVPFCHTGYSNPWHKSVQLVDHGGRRLHSVQEYAQAKWEATRTGAPRPEPMLPLDRWWLNGAVVCNVAPPPGRPPWSTESLPVVAEMLQATASAARAAGAPLPGSVFFLNRRDHPVVPMGLGRAQGPRGPHGPYWRHAVYPIRSRGGRPAALAPVFSYYVGPGVQDWAMPLPEDWAVAQAATDWATVRAEHPLSARPRRAVFRGTATGTQRAALAAHARSHDPLQEVLDVGITGWNTGRDRVVLSPDGGTMTVTYSVAPDRGVPRVGLRDQAVGHQFIVYCDGHCAASRYGALMHTGSVIVRVASADPDAGQSWLMPALQGAQPGSSDTVWAAADHVLCAGVQDVLPTVQWLVRQPQSVLDAVAANAVARAPTIEGIVAYWDAALRRAARCHAPTGTLWTSADARYADLPL